MVASLAPSSRHMLWFTRERRRSTSLTTRRTGLRRIEALSSISCLSEYTAMPKEVHAPDYDPRTEDIDIDVLMRVGGGKMHGRY
jgi:hypothetical protein